MNKLSSAIKEIFTPGTPLCALAYAALGVILATLLPAFRFVPEAAEMPRAQFRVTLRPEGGLRMRVVPRHVH